jgi:hypothetical protein
VPAEAMRTKASGGRVLDKSTSENGIDTEMKTSKKLFIGGA